MRFLISTAFDHSSLRHLQQGHEIRRVRCGQSAQLATRSVVQEERKAQSEFRDSWVLSRM